MTTSDQPLPAPTPASESTLDNTGAITQVSSSTTSSSSDNSSNNNSHCTESTTTSHTPTYRFASPLIASSWHTLLTNIEGRDKLFRLIQYICRLIRGVYLGRATPTSNTPGPLTGVYALEGALSLTRQVCRMFKWVSIYAKAGKQEESMNKNLLRLVTDCALAAYYAADNWTVLCKTGLVKRDPAVASRRAGKFWLVAVLAALTTAVVEYRKNVVLESAVKNIVGRDKKDDTQEGQRTNKDLDLRNIRRERRIISAVLAKHAADSVVAMNLSRVNSLHPALVGACGGLSSIVGFCQVWPKVLNG